MTCENIPAEPGEHPGVAVPDAITAVAPLHANGAASSAEKVCRKLLGDAIADAPARGHELAVLRLYLEQTPKPHAG